MSIYKKLDAHTIKIISAEFFDAMARDLVLSGAAPHYGEPHELFSKSYPHLAEFSEWLNRLEEVNDV